MKKWASKDIIKCPACGETYEYCHGLVNTPYFRHKEKADCDRFPEPETEEHNLGKRKLYDWICKQDGVTDVVLEGWVPETHQRPDIMFKFNNKKYVIEYQCTPIASKYFERHDLYAAGGINDIWILGVQNYMRYASDKINRKKTIEDYARLYFDSERDIVFGHLYYMFSHFKKSWYLKDLMEHISKRKFSVFNGVVAQVFDWLKFDNGSIRLTYREELKI